MEQPPVAVGDETRRQGDLERPLREGVASRRRVEGGPIVGDRKHRMDRDLRPRARGEKPGEHLGLVDEIRKRILRRVPDLGGHVDEVFQHVDAPRRHLPGDRIQFDRRAPAVLELPLDR